MADEKNCEVLSIKVSTLSGGGGGVVGEPGADEEPPLQPARISASQGTAQCKGLTVPRIIIRYFAACLPSLPVRPEIGQRAERP